MTNSCLVFQSNKLVRSDVYIKNVSICDSEHPDKNLTSFDIQLQHSSVSLRGTSGHIFIRFPVIEDIILNFYDEEAVIKI